MSSNNLAKRADEEDLTSTPQDLPREQTSESRLSTHSSTPTDSTTLLDIAPLRLLKSQRRKKNSDLQYSHSAIKRGSSSTGARNAQFIPRGCAENVSVSEQAQKPESRFQNTTQLTEQRIPRGYLLPKVHKSKPRFYLPSTIFFCISENKDQKISTNLTSSDTSQSLTMSPALMGLSSEIRERILGYVLISDHVHYMLHEEDEINFASTIAGSDCAVVPYYPQFSGDRPSELIYDAPWNKDVSILRVNKQLYEEASKVLYGRKHQFVLRDAKVVQWFTRQLGDRMKLIRTLVIELDAGLSHLCVSREKLWLNFFRYLVKDHQLERLAISFIGWTDELSVKKYGDDEWTRDCAIQARNDTIECLHTIRGLIEAQIAPCGYMSDEAAAELSGCMVAEVGMVLERTKKAQAIEKEKQNTPLAKLFATLPYR